MKSHIVAVLTAVGLLAATGGALAVAATDHSPSGGAAQAQYCPNGCTTSTPPPAGVVAVVTTFGTSGGTFTHKVAGASVDIHFPQGAVAPGTAVSLVKTDIAAVKKDLPKSLQGDKIVDAIGVELTHNGSAVRTSKPALITISAKDVTKGDIVAVFNSKTGKYQELKRVSDSNGKVTVRLTAGESIVVLHKK